MPFRRIVALTALALLVPAGARLRAAEPAVTVAHIRLSGGLDEAPAAEDPIFGHSAENLKMKLDRIKKARDDKSVQALYLEIEGIGTGWGKLDELRHALADFRKSGKKVFAYLEGGESKDYLLAVSCDEVAMPESAWLMLTGMRAEVSFYKGLFDKLGVKADMLQMGEFKGAAEPYTRSEMSPQFKKQLESVLDDYFDKSLVGAIAEARKGKGLTADKVKKLIDEGPYGAKSAAAVGLIDRVAYAADFKASFKATLKADEVKIVKDYEKSKSKDVNLSNPFELLKLLSPTKAKESKNAKVAVIYATGVITSGKSSGSLFGGETCGSTTMIEAIRKADNDKTVKAIVLRVDSPGGSALASDLMWNELVKCKKPVVASMSDTAASGGYYISMAAKKIYAEPGTLTGSIGVVGGKIVLGGLEKKVGLTTDVITRGANAGIFSTTTPFSDSERKAMTGLMKDTYDGFVNKALEGRKRAGHAMTREQLLELAGGRVWTGRQAKANGLVDEVGTVGDAILAARKMAGVPEGDALEILELPESRSFLDALLESRSDSDTEARLLAPLLREFPELAGSLRGVDALLRLRGEPVWVVLPCRVTIR
ncbi:MAG TPA: signal peptide peptidase SppA [Gemmataceae bacterium]|nr:signal peptide peptidase SppA [Gemmataceae bacterium]